MLAAGSLRKACPCYRARLVRIPSQATSIATRSARSQNARIHATAQLRPATIRHFSTSLRTLQESSNEVSANAEKQYASDTERTVHEARQRFRDTLPPGYLNKEELDLYVRLYGEPLRETAPEDVGIPFLGTETQPKPPPRDPDDPVLLRQLESGDLEEVPYYKAKAAEDAAAEQGAEEPYTEQPNDDSLSEDQVDYINATARNQREYDALVKLQQDFEAASLRAMEEAEAAEERAEEQAEEDERFMKGLEEQDAAIRAERSKEILRQKRAYDGIVEDLAYGEEEDMDLDLDRESTRGQSVRSHPYTMQGRFATHPRALQLPLTSFNQPIEQMLERTSIKHLRDAAEEAHGGPGLPRSPATPQSKMDGRPQHGLGLQARRRQMTEIQADVFISTVLPTAYATSMSALVEVRKRLGKDWLRNLLSRGDGQGPRVLDAGAGGGGLAAWQDVAQAEWDVMAEQGLVKGAEPPSKNTVVVGSDNLRRRLSRFLHDTSFLPRLPDYTHSHDNVHKLLDASETPLPRKKYDVILAPYLLLTEEKEPHRRKAILNQLWSLLSPEGGVLVVIEKASPRGFEVIAEVREKLLSEYLVSPRDRDVGHPEPAPDRDPNMRVREPGMIVAPCTNHRTCPMYPVPGVSEGRKDFCHFSQRFHRPRFLQQILGAKGANHTDVKFSYIAVQRGGEAHDELPVGGDAVQRAHEGYEHAAEAPHMLALPRQVLKPMKRKGHVQLEVCTPAGQIERWTVPKSFSKQAYRDARKAQWGDLWALGAKTRVRRGMRLGRPEAEGDGGVRAQRAKARMSGKVKEFELGYDQDGISAIKEKNAAPQRRTKGGRKPPRKTLKQEMLDEEEQRP